MSTSLETSTPDALTALIVTLVVIVFMPPLLRALRAARRSAAHTHPQYLNLCGATARPNLRGRIVKHAA